MAEKSRAARRIAALFLVAISLAPAARGGVIPLPASTRVGVGSFKLNAATVIHLSPGDLAAEQAAHYLVDLWRRTNALSLPILAAQSPGIESEGVESEGVESPRAPDIRFRTVSDYAPEAYRVEVNPQRITVSASTAAGLFYGAVTLWQLLPADIHVAAGDHQHGGEIASQTIDDSPRYAWRGLMLDSARHFQSVAFIRSMIDWMAWHKLNVFHWHLTDDQGWRLEIRKYPKLTAVGAWRGPHGGFYTQTQVRDIVAFAATRHVQIIPEIDMPGHASAAIAAYPDLGCTDHALKVSASWGVHTHLFNLEPSTFGFLEDVLTEVMQLFPSAYLHVGGDEAVKNEWQSSPQVQARARQLGIGDADALQAYFTQRIDRFLVAHGKRLVGWDEILNSGLSTDAVVMSWRGVAGAHRAAIAGNDTVLSPQPTLYLDRRQSILAGEPPGRLEVSSLRDVYEFEPRDSTLSPAQQQHVLGVQANIWTEHIQTEKRVEWMALPRAAALAEVAWSPPTQQDHGDRSWQGFLQRLIPLFARYRAFGLNYADSAFGIDSALVRSRDAANVTIALSSTAAPLSTIRYTLDGRDPSSASPRYEAPLTVPVNSQLRAATFVGTQQTSRTWMEQVSRHSGRRRDSHDLELCSNRVGLLLEPHGHTSRGAPLAVDIMNPCWIYRGVDLSRPHLLIASVAPLPFNYELGADLATVRVGDARTPQGELEIHIDSCDARAIARLPLSPAATTGNAVIQLPALTLPAARLSELEPPGSTHDLCLRFARPHLNPMWALDWIEIGE
jgi:hexosaminidase